MIGFLELGICATTFGQRIEHGPIELISLIGLVFVIGPATIDYAKASGEIPQGPSQIVVGEKFRKIGKKTNGNLMRSLVMYPEFLHHKRDLIRLCIGDIFPVML